VASGPVSACRTRQAQRPIFFFQDSKCVTWVSSSFLPRPRVLPTGTRYPTSITSLPLLIARVGPSLACPVSKDTWYLTLLNWTGFLTPWFGCNVLGWTLIASGKPYPSGLELNGKLQCPPSPCGESCWLRGCSAAERSHWLQGTEASSPATCDAKAEWPYGLGCKPLQPELCEPSLSINRLFDSCFNSCDLARSPRLSRITPSHPPWSP
jgi:hypothetical protein